MTTATISLEIELEISGTFTPGRPATRIDPPECDSVDDVTVDGLGVLSRVAGGWRTTSALDGVNTASPDVQRLLANLLELAGGGEAELIAEAGE